MGPGSKFSVGQCSVYFYITLFPRVAFSVSVTLPIGPYHNKGKMYIVGAFRYSSGGANGIEVGFFDHLSSCLTMCSMTGRGCA